MYTDKELIKLATNYQNIGVGNYSTSMVKLSKKWLKLMKIRFHSDYKSMKIYGITHYAETWLERIIEGSDYIYADNETIRALLKIDKKGGEDLFIREHKKYYWSDKSIEEKFKSATGRFLDY